MSLHNPIQWCPATRYQPATAGRLRALLVVGLSVLGAVQVQAQQAASARHPDSSLPLTADQGRIVDRARDILNHAVAGEAERQVRLEVIKASLTGTAIRPADDYPEMRNPKHWTLINDAFVVAPSSTPVDAIADMWVVHENDGVPIPRVRCYKYTSLVLIQGYIQYFRESHNPAGLAALNRLIGDRKIPQGLPNSGEDLLWKRRAGGDGLLPGDQVWFDNPFFDHGGKLIRQEIYQQALREGKPQAEAAAAADAATQSMIAGEEGSNVFYLGDDKFIRGASSLTRLCRDSFQPRDHGGVMDHEQVFTRKIYNLSRFQEHMIDDNYTAQACARENPASVRPADFKIERVRSPMDPGNLLHLSVSQDQALSVASLIDAMASRNTPPRLMTAGDGTLPIFDEAYDWKEQQRVRAAIDTLMRIKSDDSWWQLRSSIHDNRYVLTATRGAEVKNFTVGELCGDLVDSRLCLGFTSHLPLVPGRLPASFQPEQEFWLHEVQWADERKPLAAMQAALCERALQQWESVRGTLPGSDRQAHVYTTDEKTRFVAGIKKEIAMLKQTKQATCETVFVPWLAAPSGWDGFDAERAKELWKAVENKQPAIPRPPAQPPTLSTMATPKANS